MAWMANHAERRADPRLLMDNLGVVMVLGVNYKPDGDLMEELSHGENAYISAYARNNDYHDILKKRTKALARWLAERLGQPMDGRVFVDTAPVLERPLAAQSGIGWQGKNTMLASRKFGCWLFLAEYFIALPLPPDQVEEDHCGECDRCQRACPTGALDDPYRMDARQCLAYWSIESSGVIPQKFRRLMGNRIYGCDDCIVVCPFNRFADMTRESDFVARDALKDREMISLMFARDADFREALRKTPIKRLGFSKFIRNLAIGLGNWGRESGERSAFDLLLALLDHESPMARAHAAWGVGECVAYAEEGMAALRQKLAQEPDAQAREEMRSALYLLAARNGARALMQSEPLVEVELGLDGAAPDGAAP
ncbi:putative iron-sulfur cluster binding protein [Magnetofaba australis IT-1]|uniref:Putative iron-sulfur cluster binding protein n=2 Tax=Magnetofaba TaxID=1472292 RepID=A0A1Y2K4T8_9PROT|nr:putative iron-sulfur cluster binding protein [Magnetofaba australis IT-1]